MLSEGYQFEECVCDVIDIEAMRGGDWLTDGVVGSWGSWMGLVFGIVLYDSIMLMVGMAGVCFQRWWLRGIVGHRCRWMYGSVSGKDGIERFSDLRSSNPKMVWKTVAQLNSPQRC